MWNIYAQNRHWGGNYYFFTFVLIILQEFIGDQAKTKKKVWVVYEQ